MMIQIKQNPRTTESYYNKQEEQKEQRETAKITETRKTDQKMEKEQKNRQKYLQYETCRKTLISMEDGLRTLNIASLNPDTMRET